MGSTWEPPEPSESAAALAVGRVVPWVASLHAQAISGAPGGAAAPTGSEESAVDKTGAKLVPYRPAGAHPVLTALSVPKSSTPGKPPKVTLKVSEPGVGTVYVKVKITPLDGHRRLGDPRPHGVGRTPNGP